MRRALLIAVFALAGTATALSGSPASGEPRHDELRLKNGERLSGTIVEIRPDSGLLVRGEDGGERLVLFEELDGVQRAMFEPAAVPLGNRAYAEVGVALGIPMGANLLVGGTYHGLGLMLSGSPRIVEAAGVQAFLGGKFNHTTRGYLAFGPVVGAASESERGDEIRYAGVWSNFVARHLFIGLGLVNVSGDEEGTKFVFQLGAIGRVRRDGASVALPAGAP